MVVKVRSVEIINSSQKFSCSLFQKHVTTIKIQVLQSPLLSADSPSLGSDSETTRWQGLMLLDEADDHQYHPLRPPEAVDAVVVVVEAEQ